MDIQIAKKIRSLRIKHGLSQEELAGKIGVSRQAVSKWERGESSPDTDNLLALTKVYDLTMDEMLFSKNLTSDQKNVVNLKSNNQTKTWKEEKSKWRGIPFPIVAVIKVIFLLKQLFSEKKIEKDK
ncbi:MAG: helix-turn-helix domain-containing protein [Bacteroidota bacterium]